MVQRILLRDFGGKRRLRRGSGWNERQAQRFGGTGRSEQRMRFYGVGRTAAVGSLCLAGTAETIHRRQNIIGSLVALVDEDATPRRVHSRQDGRAVN